MNSVKVFAFMALISVGVRATEQQPHEDKKDLDAETLAVLLQLSAGVGRNESNNTVEQWRNLSPLMVEYAQEPAPVVEAQQLEAPVKKKKTFWDSLKAWADEWGWSPHIDGTYPSQSRIGSQHAQEQGWQ